jgi:hypothetical protein
MSKPTKTSRKTNRHSRKHSRKSVHKKRAKTGKKNYKRISNKKNQTAKLTQKNWMKKLIFTGGDASHHAENVFGGPGQQNAAGENNNAIYQNPLGSGIPGTNAGETL